MKNETWILNVKTNTMTQGPSLNTGRYYHGCARLNDGSIIVAGGLSKNQWHIIDSTEILKIGEHEWKPGPHLPERVSRYKLVKSQRKDYVAYGLGGETKIFLGQRYRYTSSSKIYGLHRGTNEWQLIGNMEKPRDTGSAVNMPSNMIQWCEK